MIYVILYKNKYGQLTFKASEFTGLARHTCKADAEYTIRKSKCDGEIMKFKNMHEASEHLKTIRESFAKPDKL